ncbi:MAG: DegV family protein [Evtepia sp.]
MRNFVIMTDSSCDLPSEMAADLELSVVSLSVLIQGKSYVNYLDNRELPSKTFYDLLRHGEKGSTSAVNVEQFSREMERILQTGQDILYLGFSTGLSGTYSAGTVAAEEMRTKYPEAQILTVDTLCASLGEGMIVSLAVQEKRSGKSILEVRDFVEANKLHLCHWVAVDDLQHLKRGGRISAAAAFFGSALNVKPIIHVDNEGKLIPVEKIKGRKNSIKRLVQHLTDTGINLSEQTLFLCHGDCPEEANMLADIIRSETLVRDIVIGPIGPVIGAHAGPGTLALFFLGTER